MCVCICLAKFVRTNLSLRTFLGKGGHFLFDPYSLKGLRLSCRIQVWAGRYIILTHVLTKTGILCVLLVYLVGSWPV